MRFFKFSGGQSATELALVLPVAVAMMAAVVEMALIGLRSISLQHAAFRAARVAEVYQEGYAPAELYAMLDPALFQASEISRPGGKAGDVLIGALSRPIADLKTLVPGSVMFRSSPQGRSLPADLSDAVLRGGDTPSPYCVIDEGYGVCGYPK